MTLDPWDCADVDACATRCGQEGKHKANALFHNWANRQGWFGTDKWIAARTRFRAAHKAARAEYFATLTPTTETPRTGFLGDWRGTSSTDWSDNA
jgi:hypothetical protein